MFIVGILCGNVWQLNLLMVGNLGVKREGMPMGTERVRFYKHVLRVFRIRRELGFISSVAWNRHFFLYCGAQHLVH